MVAIHSVAELVAAHERFVRDLATSLQGALERGEVQPGAGQGAVLAALLELHASANSACIAGQLLAKVEG